MSELKTQIGDIVEYKVTGERDKVIDIVKVGNSPLRTIVLESGQKDWETSFHRMYRIITERTETARRIKNLAQEMFDYGYENPLKELTAHAEVRNMYNLHDVPMGVIIALQGMICAGQELRKHDDALGGEK